MNKSITLCLVLFTVFMLSSCNGPHNKLHDIPHEIISDFNSTATPFIVFRINYENKNYHLAIQNVDLYHNHISTFGLNTHEYEINLKKHIDNNIPFIISDDTWNLVWPYIIRYHPKVDLISRFGSDALVNYYFDDFGQIKFNLSYFEFGYLIKKLFDYGIYTTKADVSGRFSLYHIHLGDESFPGDCEDGAWCAPVIPEVP